MPLLAATARVPKLTRADRGLVKGSREIARKLPQKRELAETGESSKEEDSDEATKKTSALISAEGILMLSVGGLLDILSIIGAILIIAFGTGLIFAKIVYIVGFFIVSTWVFFRSGATPGKGKMRKKIVRGLLNFLKRQWPKLAGKAVPAVGDVLPLWTWTIYSELTSG